MLNNTNTYVRALVDTMRTIICRTECPKGKLILLVKSENVRSNSSAKSAGVMSERVHSDPPHRRILVVF